MEWTKLFFVKSLVCLATGIFLGNSFVSYHPPFYLLLTINLSLFACILLFHVSFKKSLQSHLTTIKSAFIFLFHISIGFTLYQISQPAYNQYHFSHYRFSSYQAELARPLTKGSNSLKGILEVKAIKTAEGWQKAEGRIMGFFTPGDTIAVGTLLMLSDLPRTPDPPLNPFQFDYREYLKTQEIYHIAFIRQYTAIAAASPYSLNLFRIAELCVSHLNHILQKYLINREAYALVLGLLLGDKSEMDPEINQMYTVTGLAHVLAVSGFHTALIYQLLVIVFGFLPKNTTGRIIFTASVIVFLWFYAICTGLSASVIRAALMLTILVSTRLLKRRPNTIHILCLSAFLIILHSPPALFDIGLQLSFAAVAGITCVNQRLNDSITIKQPVLKILWEWTCISLSAQLFTYPLLLYYFYDLPLYFIAANLISTLPVVLLIYLSIILLTFSWLPWIGTITGIVITWLTIGLNSSVTFLAELPSFTQGLFFHPAQILILFVLTSFFASGIIFRRIRLLLISYTLLMVFVLISFIQFYQSSDQKILAVFHIKNHSFIAFIDGFNATVVSSHTNAPESKEYQYSVAAYLGSKHIRSVSFKPLDSAQLLLFSDKKIALVTHANHLSEHVKADYIIATHISSNVSGILSAFDNAKLIFDGTCNKKMIKDVNSSVHYTWVKGAYIEHL